MAKSPLHSSK